MRFVCLLPPCLALFCLPLSGGVQACGYEDPTTIAIGALNFAYPNALYVGTAIWQAQADGKLPRHDPAEAGSTDPQRQQAALWEVMRLTERLRAQIERWPRTSVPPALVFADSALWTRFVWQGERLVTVSHQSGPAAGEVVLVTAPVALRAVLDGRVSFASALESGIMRDYGSDAARAQLGEVWQTVSKESAPQ